MATCDICKNDWPDRFLAPMFRNGEYLIIDPECALEAMGCTKFSGEMAQQLLEDFREWKKANEGNRRKH